MRQGRAQGVEGAYYFSRFLEKDGSYKEDFEAFQNKKVNQIVKGSWQLGKLTHINNRQWLRNFILRNISKKNSSQTNGSTIRIRANLNSRTSVISN